ncbi:MAG: sodium/solute symporter [Bacteroidia bacterium]|nr:sodium/solute symporter [Bacteroidia bacterium]
MQLRKLPFLIFCLALAFQLQGQRSLNWENLAPLPPSAGQEVQLGLGGAFSGTHQGALILAGGCNFREKMPNYGGAKSWYRDVYVMADPESASPAWVTNPAWELPHNLAYGVSVITSNGIWLIGGNNADSICRGVHRLSWNPSQSEIKLEKMPALPVPLAYAAGAQAGNWIFVAGGHDQQPGGKPTQHFFGINLSREGQSDFGWEELPAWPGPERYLASAAGQGDGYTQRFYLFGGGRFEENGEFQPLSDAYSYHPGERTWKKLAPCYPKNRTEKASLGAPTVAVGSGHILLIGGSDGILTKMMVSMNLQIASIEAKLDTTQNPADRARLDSSRSFIRASLNRLIDNFNGFNPEVLSYHTYADVWTLTDLLETPAQVVTNAVKIGDQIFIPSGEVSVGRRTPGTLRGTFKQLKSFGWLDYSVIGIYLLVLVGMGLFFSGREKTSDDYFRAGGRIPWWAAGLSIVGTGLSAISYMAVPAKTFSTDWLFLMLSMSQALVAPVVVYLFIPFFRRLNITSAYEYLEKRFNLATRLVGSLSFILFQFGRIGIVLFLPSLALSVVTGMDIYFCILAMGVLSIIYTVIGGVEAVIWTDVLQVVVLLGGAIICLFTIFNGIEGGFSGMMDIAATDHKFKTFDFSMDLSTPTFWVVLAGGFATHLIMYSSDQTMVQRYLTTKDEKSAKRSVWTFISVAIPSVFLFFLLGTALYVFYKVHPGSMLSTLENNDAILPWFISSQLPRGMAGLLVAGIFAASMSSLDSSMNSISAVITTDFYKIIWKDSTDKKVLRFAKWITLLVGLIGMGFALVMAGFEIKSLWDEFNKVLGLFAGGLAGLFLLGMLTQRANGAGALTGFAASALIQFLVSSFTDLHFLLYALSGIVSCVAIGYLASLIFRAKAKDISGMTIHNQPKT